jgi:prepilin-type N-terminal cleavage/methylation domain-containing protein
MKRAFTLAEVLITLGIIGIVAALTMPALIANYKKHEVVVRLKKFNSAMSQAVLQSQVDHGEISQWTFPSSTKNDDGTVNSKPAKDFFLEYLAPYVKYVQFSEIKFTDEKKDIHDTDAVLFADGSYVILKIGACIDYIYDINGLKAPNLFGQDMFLFTLCPSGRTECGKDRKGGFCIPYFDTYATREALLNVCKTASGATKCNVLIQYDGWEIKDDYPWL